MAGADVEAVIFDMDGVLIDSGAWHRQAWAALLHELGEVPRPDSWRLTIGRPSEEAIPLLLGRRLREYEAWELARRKRDLYVDLSRRGMQPVAGVGAFVEALVRHDVPRAIGTSASNADVDRLLREVGLRNHFRVVVTSDDTTSGKPDPEVYQLAARRLKVDVAGCVVFEDSLVGIEAARRAGMRAIGVSTAYGEDELLAAGAEQVIPHFEGLTWPMIRGE
jgi:HAD superfamily hydrolase (TIGR01509 family)